ncbi:MAG: sulfite oxidase-like oxidoreductase [Acidimicrobiia bacterium]|nr:sulfite oxidase-like oxidoreductase [Acidimicrobiia bacterium]NNL28732.1 sulfite oxidase-like oxidoreductase [Acidimicrobiia bacterium]
MGFFDKQPAEMRARGLDPSRLPPGQYVTDRFPVLHTGSVPRIDIDEWDFTVDGLVDNPLRFTYEDVLGLETSKLVADIHCVTKWSKFDTEWEGVPVTHFLEKAGVASNATHVVVNAEHGFTANLPMADFSRPENLFAYRFGSEQLELEHGWPLRLVVPHLYFWKSVKWCRGFTLVDRDQPGFWERNGYHMYGDPFKEQRYWGD